MKLAPRASLALVLLLVPACRGKGGASADKPAPSASAAIAAHSAHAPAAPTVDPKAIPAPADVAAPPADATKTASGLAYKVLTPGTGKDHPGAEDKVKVHYTGWQSADGRMFDSSVSRGNPTSFRLNQVIKGWTEGVQLMTVGEKTRFWIPAELAYGECKGTAVGGRPCGLLVFDVELLEVAPAPKPPAVPTDVKAAPATAKKTASGLAYRLLEKGTGTQHPKATDRVKVNYSGWTTDGRMFDSSVTRGEPVTFGLNQVIKGWTEGVQLMNVGDKMRFWIPGELAYGDKPTRPGAPSGTLVFDVELLGIQ